MIEAHYFGLLHAGGKALHAQESTLNIQEIRSVLGQALGICDVRTGQLVFVSLLGTLATIFRIISMAAFLPLVQVTFSDTGGSGGRLKFVFEWLDVPGDQLYLVLIALIVVVGILSAVLTYLAEYWTSKMTLYSEKVVNRKVFRTFMSFGQAYFDQRTSADASGELSNTPKRMAGVIRVLSRDFRAVLQIVIFGAALLYLSWPAAMGLFAVLFLYSYYFKDMFLRRGLDEFEEEEREDRAQVELHDLISNISLVRQFGAAQEEGQRWDEYQRNRYKIQRKRNRVSMLAEPLNQFVLLLIMLGLVFAISFSIGRVEPLDIMRFIIFFLFARRIMGSFSRVQNIPSNYTTIRKQVERYQALMSPEDKGIVSCGDLEISSIESDIIVSGLDFHYGEPRVLDGIDMQLPHNQCTAIVGLSGSGKSSFLRLLLRQYEYQAGDILVNGNSLRDYSWESLLAITEYLGPDPLFFNETIEYNLKYGNEEVTEEDLIQALERMQCAEFVAELDNGLQTVLGGKGGRLSRGQLQRLGLARMFLQPGASLMLLDEATAALDEALERKVLEGLSTFPGATVIFVTHRIAGISDQMNVRVFAGGKVVEQGTRQELELRPDSAFNALWKSEQSTGQAVSV